MSTPVGSYASSSGNNPGGVWGGGVTGGPGTQSQFQGPQTSQPNTRVSPGWGNSFAQAPQGAPSWYSAQAHPYAWPGNTFSPPSQTPGYGSQIYGSGMGVNPWATPATVAGFAPSPNAAPPQGAGGPPQGASVRSDVGTTLDWSQAPYANPGQFAGGANKAEWQKEVGADENWIQNTMRRGMRVGGAIPGMFKGDILQENQYGMMAPNIDAAGKRIFVPKTNPGPDEPQGGYWRPMTQDEINQLGAYRGWTENEENQQGGGAVQAWGAAQGYGNNTAANDWGGAYSAYWAHLAQQAGVAPGAGFGTGTTAASSPQGVWQDPSTGQTYYYNQLKNGISWFNQYGLPTAAPTGAGAGNQPGMYSPYGMPFGGYQQPPMTFYGGGQPQF